MRSTFGSSKLVRLLAQWAPAAPEAPGMDFAERLSLWLGAFDAIGLQAALQSIRAVETAAPPGGAGGLGQAPRASARARPNRTRYVAEDLQRARAVLARGIAQDPLVLAGLEAAADPGYAPFHQRHVELQRQMELMIAPLRDHVRRSLAGRSGALRRLAALDAALEQVLAPREQALLGALPALLRRRFEQRRQHADGLAAFGQDWRQALLAELDLRLEPVTGLVEAARNESDRQR